MPDEKTLGAILENIKNVSLELKNVRDDIRHIDKKMDGLFQRVTTVEVKIQGIDRLREELQKTEDIIFAELRERQTIREADIKDADARCHVARSELQKTIEKNVYANTKNSILALQVLTLTSLLVASGSIIFTILKFYLMGR